MRTALGKDTHTGKRIFVSDKSRRGGIYILGASGMGKSQLLADLVYQDAQKDYAIIVLDPHRDLIDHVMSILPEERLTQTYLLDLEDTAYPYSTNLLACANPDDEIERMITLERVMRVFARLWPETRGVLLEKLLRYVALTLLEHPGSTILDISKLLWDDAYRTHMIRSLANEEVKAYWEKEYTMMTIGERRKEIQALENRLAALRSTALIRNIIGQREHRLDFKQAILDREILLIHLPERLETAAHLIGTILLAQIHAATFAFGTLPWDKRPGFSLIADEFQYYATIDSAALLKEGRKYGIRLAFAHQDRQDLLPVIRSATLTASTIITMRPTPADAAELAPLYVDSSAALRPQRLYRDVVGRLRMHEHPLVHGYYQHYVRPLQLEKHRHEEKLDVLETLQDLLYQSIKTGRVHEALLDTYLQSLYPLLNLTFNVLEDGRKQLFGQLQQRENTIARLQSYLSGEDAVWDYLALYYSYFSPLSEYHSVHQSERMPLAGDNLLAHAPYWKYVLEVAPSEKPERQEMLAQLERLAATNAALRNRNTRVRILAQERMRVRRRCQWLFRRIWKDIETLHRLKGKYACNRAVAEFHESQYHTYCVIPSGQKPHPVYYYPTRSSKSEIITERTRRKDLVVQPLSIDLASMEIVTSWIPFDGYVNPLGPDDPEALHVYTIIEDVWRDIVTRYDEMQSIAPALSDTAVLLRVYYLGNTLAGAEQHLARASLAHQNELWERLRCEAKKNAWLANHMDTVDKLVHARKCELRKKIALLIREQKACEDALLPLEREINQAIAVIEEQRSAIRDNMRQVLDVLIADPGPLGEPRGLRESDIKEQLLGLGTRQALVRVTHPDQKPHTHLMQTADAPQAVKRDVAEQRNQQIREQTRAKYCQEQGKIEKEIRDADFHMPERQDAPEPWYEEEQ